MDLICPVCREPWDNDCLHDRVEELKEEGRSTTYSAVARDFRRRGCEALGELHYCGRCDRSFPGDHEHFSEEETAEVRAVYELLGDDMDGAAGMLEDFGL